MSWLRNLFGLGSKAGEEKGLEEIGEVIGYFAVPHAAVIRLNKGELKNGDRILIKGHTTNFKVKVESMQIEHKPIEVAKKGDEFGLKVNQKVRRSDKVYRLA